MHVISRNRTDGPTADLLLLEASSGQKDEANASVNLTLLLVAMHLATSSFLLLVVRHLTTSSILAIEFDMGYQYQSTFLFSESAEADFELAHVNKFNLYEIKVDTRKRPFGDLLRSFFLDALS